MAGMNQEHVFEAPLWKWRDESAWHFVTLPFDVTDDIDEQHGHSAKGFGSLPVEVTVGRTTWRTSVFPSKEEQSFLLPMKAAVRKAEGLVVGEPVSVRLRVVD